MKEKKSKAEEYMQGWKRALADYENLKKDMAAQLSQSRQRIKADFAGDLLPVLDNFDQAIAHAPDLQGSEKSWLDGVLFIKKQFEEVLAGLGLEKIIVADEFDPHTMEAVGEGEEMQEVSTGWKIGDDVIRPAKVIVKK